MKAFTHRVLPSEGRGHRFESCRVRHGFPSITGDFWNRSNWAWRSLRRSHALTQRGENDDQQNR